MRTPKPLRFQKLLKPELEDAADPLGIGNFGGRCGDGHDDIRPAFVTAARNDARILP